MTSQNEALCLTPRHSLKDKSVRPDGAGISQGYGACSLSRVQPAAPLVRGKATKRTAAPPLAAVRNNLQCVPACRRHKIKTTQRQKRAAKEKAGSALAWGAGVLPAVVIKIACQCARALLKIASGKKFYKNRGRVFVSSAQTVAAYSENARKVCWPLYFAGIVVGVTNESQVRRLLGNGHFDRDEGSTDGLYFIDRQHKMTLHAVMYTDGVVGELSISRENNSNFNTEVLNQAVTDNLNVADGFGNWHRLKLGSTKQEVLENLGKPTKANSESVWRYDTRCSCEIQNYFMIYFSNGKIDRVVFLVPPG